MNPPPPQGGHRKKLKKGISDGAAGGRLKGIYVFLPFLSQEIFPRQPVLVREGVSIHNTHVMNAVCPYLPEFADQEVSLMLRLVLEE